MELLWSKLMRMGQFVEKGHNPFHMIMCRVAVILNIGQRNVIMIFVMNGVPKAKNGA